MVAGNDSEFSSPFDAMLDQDRKRLDQLYQGPADDRYSPSTRSKSSPMVPSRPRPAAVRSVRAPSDPARILDEKYGDSWRHEVVERRRDGEDMVVSCRLTIAANGIDLTRSGRARIGRNSSRSEIIGSADGIPFSFRSEDATGADGAVDDAVERAVAEALAKCVTAI